MISRPLHLQVAALLLAAFAVAGCQADPEPPASSPPASDAAPAASSEASPAPEPEAPPAEATGAASPDPSAPDEATASAAPADSLQNLYAIETPYGTLTVRLYDETPLHRDNFQKLVQTQFYDSTLFHRVIAGFMIQGGDPNSRDDNAMNDGQGGPGYTVPGEFVRRFIHKKGALAAARQGDNVNPERASSGSQFYIVQGRPVDDATLSDMEAMVRQQIGDTTFAYTDEERELYTTVGGTPPLDMQYTVFGEVVDGLDVLDEIAYVPTPNQRGQRVHPALADRPLEPVWMVIRPAEEAGLEDTGGSE